MADNINPKLIDAGSTEALADEFAELEEKHIALIEERTALQADNQALQASNAALRAELAELETAHRGLSKSYDSLLVDMMKPQPIAVHQGPDARDNNCVNAKRHVSGCGCTGEMRGPISG